MTAQMPLPRVGTCAHLRPARRSNFESCSSSHALGIVYRSFFERLCEDTAKCLHVSSSRLHHAVSDLLTLHRTDTSQWGCVGSDAIPSLQFVLECWSEGPKGERRWAANITGPSVSSCLAKGGSKHRYDRVNAVSASQFDHGFALLMASLETFSSTKRSYA